MKDKKILVVDDEQTILDTVSDILEDEDYQVITAIDGKECLKIIAEGDMPDLVLLDIWMPGIDGIEVLKKIREENPYLPVIIMSGHATIETAVEATKLGAFDFIEKPLSMDQLLVSCEKALKFKELQEENVLLREKAGHVKEITGTSMVIQELKEQIQIVAPTDAWVLIQGENGTGKELVAQTIHRLSKRASKPLIDINCAAIPDELIESELFGHEKGAFTGAAARKRGKFELANGGTLFMDEIGDMSMNTQAKILRVLQEQKFQRVGGSRTIKVDVRIIAATNKNLEEEIKKGNFREDLYFRLNVIPIIVPPLRDRKEDIPILVEQFLKEFSPGGVKIEAEDGVIQALQAYDWPGNIRELRNLIERLVILSRNGKIRFKDLPPQIVEKAGISGKVNATSKNSCCFQDTGSAYPSCFTCPDFKKAKTEFEREYLRMKLKEFDGNIKKTAESIGIERRHLHRKIKSLGLA